MLNNAQNLFTIFSILNTLTFFICTAIETPKYLNEFVVEIPLGYSHARSVAARMGMVLQHKMQSFDNMYVFKLKEDKKVNGEMKFHSNRLKRSTGVLWMEQQIELKRTKRAPLVTDLRKEMVFNDPLYMKQWYLNRGFYNPDQYDMNVIEAWQLGYTGKNVVVTVLDDGIDYTHPDLADNYDPKASYDLNGNDADPMPNVNSEGNNHGTQCGGEISAKANNNVCGVGVAYNSKLGGIRMLDGSITDRVEGESLSFRQQYIDIYSGSWGPDDNGRLLEGPGRLAHASFERGTKFGRRGLGNIYVWASGNGGAFDSCAADGYTSSIHTIAISSAGEQNVKAWFMERCAATMAVTYTGGGSTTDKKIITTYPGGICSESFTGTSASAPLAAGIYALTLEANPNLTWRDIQYLTVLTSDMTPFKDSNSFINGGNIRVSPDFGFGLMNAGKLVRLGLLWNTLPAQKIRYTPYQSVKKPLSGIFQVRATINIKKDKSDPQVNFLEHVIIKLKIEYQKRGALRIILTSPAGTRSEILPYRVRDTNSGIAYLDKWPLMSVHFWGESSVGEWIIEVDNIESKTSGYNGLFSSFKLEFYGTESSPIRLKKPNFTKEEDKSWFQRYERYVVDGNQTNSIPNSKVALSTPTGLVQCHEECSNSKCTKYGAQFCSACKNYKTKDNFCVKHCPYGTYPVQQTKTCLRCHWSCGECSGPSIKECTQCLPFDAFVIKSNRTQCQLSNNNCGAGQYRANKTGGKCGKCPTNCDVCVSPTKCVTCKPSFILSMYWHCTNQCEMGAYADIALRCRVCHGNCLTCVGSKSYHCSSCINGQYLLPLTSVIAQFPNKGYVGQCVAKCPFGQFVNKHGYYCYECHPSCKTCSDPQPNSCTSCLPPLVLSKPNNTCIDPSLNNCLPDEFKSPNGACVKCPANCASCTAKICTNCSSSTPFMHRNLCLSRCPPHFIGLPQQKICVPCTDYCGVNKDIVPPHMVDFCSTCSTITRKTIINSNSTDCDSNQFFNDQNKTCQSCHESCSTCVGDSSNQCLSCSSNQNFYKSQCITNCPINTHSFLIPTNISSCIPCHYSCLNGTCDSINGKCISCPEGHTLSVFGDRCIRIITCRMSQFWQQNQSKCTGCESSCRSCIKSTNQCTSCYRNHCLHPKTNICKRCCYFTTSYYDKYSHYHIERNTVVPIANNSRQATKEADCSVCVYDKELCPLDDRDSKHTLYDKQPLIFEYPITTIVLIILFLSSMFWLIFWLLWKPKFISHFIQIFSNNINNGKKLDYKNKSHKTSMQYQPLLGNQDDEEEEGEDEDDESEIDVFQRDDFLTISNNSGNSNDIDDKPYTNGHVNSNGINT